MTSYIYTGPSWAARSYNVPDGDWNDYTNLALEWGFDFINVSQVASNNYQCLHRVKESVIQTNCKKVIWVYCEPLVVLEDKKYDASDLPNNLTVENFLTSDDIHSFRCDLALAELQKIKEIDAEIAFVGGHSDVFNEIKNYFSNVDVLDSSWQKFLDNEINVGWGVEVGHRLLVQNPSIKPSKKVVNEMDEHFYNWKKLVQKELFCLVHPTRVGNEMYANYLKPLVKNFVFES